MDHYTLGGIGSQTVDVGSYTFADPGPDFDFGSLFKAQFVESAAAEGGLLAYETSGVRHFKFPLVLASSGVFAGGVPGLAGTLRTLAKAGAYIDLQPDGVASDFAVRFDVLAGRLEEAYFLPEQRVARRRATLFLDVQPFGYLPTQIILASTASVGFPGTLTVPGASVIGDVPGLAQIVVQASTPTSYPGGSWLSDMVAWSLSARPSMPAFAPAASLTGLLTASLAGNLFAAGSQALQLLFSPTQGGWTQMAYLAIGSAMEPAYRGRHRLYAFARVTPSQLPFQISADLVGGLQTGRSLASAMPVASVTPGAGGSYIAGSPAFQILDLGEISAPATASGLPQSLQVRLWGCPGSTGAPVASPATLHIGGLYMQPLDRGAGVLPRGLAQPSMLTPSVTRLEINAIVPRVNLAAVGANLATPMTPLEDGLLHYRGDMPRVSASTIQLDLLAGQRSAGSGATAPVVRAAEGFAAVSVSYRPRFTFLRSI